MQLGNPAVPHPPYAVVVPTELAVVFVGAQTFASVGHEVQHPIELLSLQAGVTLGIPELRKELRILEAVSASQGHKMLGKHVQGFGEGPTVFDPCRASRCGPLELPRGGKLQQLQGVGGDEEHPRGAARLMRTPSGPLHEPGNRLW